MHRTLPALALVLSACGGPAPPTPAPSPAPSPAIPSTPIAANASDPAENVETSLPEAPFAQDGGQAAADVVQRYLALLADRRYPEAYRLWRDGGARSGMSEAEFAASFARYSTLRGEVGEQLAELALQLEELGLQVAGAVALQEGRRGERHDEERDEECEQPGLDGEVSFLPVEGDQRKGCNPLRTHTRHPHPWIWSNVPRKPSAQHLLITRADLEALG